MPISFRARGRITPRGELLLAVFAIIVTVCGAIFVGRDLISAFRAAEPHPLPAAQIVLFALILGILISSNLVHLCMRVGYLVRRARHEHAPFEEVVASHWEDAEPIAILIPSYKEDPRTIWQTVLSAALQHHPCKRVVLLIDDPPHPGDRASADRLAYARRIPAEVSIFLQTPRALIERARDAFEQRRSQGATDVDTDVRALLRLHGDLMRWLRACAESAAVGDHTDALFRSVTFTEHAALLRDHVARLCVEPWFPDSYADSIAREYDRLTAVFAVDVSTFERKRYQNLAHESNKASNLNTYIGLLGRSVYDMWRDDGLYLEVGCVGEQIPGARRIDDAAFVLTLDADSMLRPDYALRLSEVFSREGHERTAVVQSPYAAIPHPPGALERIAGATTDMQYITHQGFTWCDATFWVGANALIRKRALEDICQLTSERGYVVPRFIQDATVIEDTESTIDLTERGWRLWNYPKRLAYSATPPDFGALIIQRCRWANGGLLIAPKLLRQMLTRRPSWLTLPSFLVRLHYLTSIATGSLATLVLLTLPMDADVFSMWMVVIAAAYSLVYWRGLRESGYRFSDLLRVGAFNLMLVPINLAGVSKSLQQGFTGVKTPFARTPKVQGRTLAPAWAVGSLVVLALWSGGAGAMHLVRAEWLYASFSLIMASGFVYALVAFIGVRAAWEDMTHGVRSALSRSTIRIAPPNVGHSR